MKRRTLVISVASLFVVLLLFRLSGMRSPIMGAALAIAAGYVIGGWLGVRVAAWIPFAVGLAAVGTLLGGLSQYNDDGPSGAALDVLLFSAIALFVALAFIGGLAFGGASRRRGTSQ